MKKIIYNRVVTNGKTYYAKGPIQFDYSESQQEITLVFYDAKGDKIVSLPVGLVLHIIPIDYIPSRD